MFTKIRIKLVWLEQVIYFIYYFYLFNFLSSGWAGVHPKEGYDEPSSWAKFG
jgi:hypothetical protein